MQGPQNRSHKTSGRPGVGVIPVDHGQQVSRCQQQDQLPIVASGCGGRLGHNDAAASLGCKTIKCDFEFSGVVNGMSNVFTPKADAAALKADMLSPAAGARAKQLGLTATASVPLGKEKPRRADGAVNSLARLRAPILMQAANEEPPALD